MGTPVRLLVNIDVPDLAAAEAFYVAAFGLTPARRLGDSVVELLGAGAALYLLEKQVGSEAVMNSPRRYERHWTPLHCDWIVEDVEAALRQAIAAGAEQEGPVRDAIWGRIVQLADPFGHGWCLIQFLNRGYDEIAT